MLNDTDYDAILNRLDLMASRKEETALAKAHAEINTINKAREAYYDGAYDAIKEIKNAVAKAKETPANPR